MTPLTLSPRPHAACAEAAPHPIGGGFSRENRGLSTSQMARPNDFVLQDSDSPCSFIRFHSVTRLTPRALAARVRLPPAAASAARIASTLKEPRRRASGRRTGSVVRYAGRSVRPISSPRLVIAAYSSALISCRTFPGQQYDCSYSSAAGVTRSQARSFATPMRARKCAISSGMSALRSRSGGSVIGMTLTR